MHCLARFRSVILGAAFTFSFAAHADYELDTLVEEHVMPRFNQQARAFIRGFGGRFVSSRWDSGTRTLIAVAELEDRMAPGPVDVALASGRDARTRGFKTRHVDALCRHSDAKLINRFLEKHDVTIELVYDRMHLPVAPLVVEISHHDLRGCV